MSFTEYIGKMKELGWKEEELKDDYLLYERTQKQGIDLPWQLFLKPAWRK